MSQRVRDWYARNRLEQRRKARERQAHYRSFNQRLRRLILSARPCADCNEPPDHEAPFEFDHRVDIGAGSQRRISDLIAKGTSAAALLREIALCDVVCPTCHKRRTYLRAGWSQ